MTLSSPENQKLVIRSLQYRDLETIGLLSEQYSQDGQEAGYVSLEQKIKQVRSWYGLLKFLSLFPNPCQHTFRVYIAEQSQQIRGLIQVAPFNSTRSTWKVEKVLVDLHSCDPELATGRNGTGSQLLRYCFETLWEARTWILEVNIHNKTILALYRQNGFQPLAQMTYWAIAPEMLQQLAQHEPDLPNLLPVSNADAYLLYQLDTVSMPPLLRQVFDRHIYDFKSGLINTFVNKLRQLFGHRKIVSGYVFEPQRKAAIGYFKLDLCDDGSRPHKADLTVHPAYTWLYPQLLTQMAQITQDLPPQSLELASADYQPEREEYLEQLGAERIEHTLLMSRSVWHKLRETKPLEGLQLSDVLQGLQPTRTPIPSRMSWLKLFGKSSRFPTTHREVSKAKSNAIPPKSISPEKGRSGESPHTSGNGHHA